MNTKSITEQEETFLILKYGKSYTSKVVEKWHEKGELCESEKKVCLAWLKKVAGIDKEEL